jgi:hypothetical protein
MLGTLCALSLLSSSKMYVESASLNHIGGWPTASDPPHLNYMWEARSNGDVLYGPGNQINDPTYPKVTARYSASHYIQIYGTYASEVKSFYLDRRQIAITFTVTYQGASAPSAPGLAEIDRGYRVAATTDLPVTSGYATATTWYNQPPLLEFTALADQIEFHKEVTGKAPKLYAFSPTSWINVSPGVWKVSVTVPLPPPDPAEDQDILLTGLASGQGSGTGMSGWVSSVGEWSYRLTKLGNILLQCDL